MVPYVNVTSSALTLSIRVLWFQVRQTFALMIGRISRTSRFYHNVSIHVVIAIKLALRVGILLAYAGRFAGRHVCGWGWNLAGRTECRTCDELGS